MTLVAIYSTSPRADDHGVLACDGDMIKRNRCLIKPNEECKAANLGAIVATGLWAYCLRLLPESAAQYSTFDLRAVERGRCAHAGALCL